jgi:hypothetical protein
MSRRALLILAAAELFKSVRSVNDEEEPGTACSAQAAIAAGTSGDSPNAAPAPASSAAAPSAAEGCTTRPPIASGTPVARSGRTGSPSAAHSPSAAAPGSGSPDGILVSGPSVPSASASATPGA